MDWGSDGGKGYGWVGCGVGRGMWGRGDGGAGGGGGGWVGWGRSERGRKEMVWWAGGWVLPLCGPAAAASAHHHIAPTTHPPPRLPRFPPPPAPLPLARPLETNFTYLLVARLGFRGCISTTFLVARGGFRGPISTPRFWAPPISFY